MKGYSPLRRKLSAALHLAELIFNCWWSTISRVRLFAKLNQKQKKKQLHYLIELHTHILVHINILMSVDHKATLDLYNTAKQKPKV